MAKAKFVHLVSHDGFLWALDAEGRLWRRALSGTWRLQIDTRDN